MYHRFTNDIEVRKLNIKVFENQIRYISRYFTPIKISYLIEQLYNGGYIPSNSVVVTVDDGYRDFFDYAYPVLKKYNVPAIIYLVSEFNLNKKMLWFDSLHFIINNTECECLYIEENNEKFKLNNITETDRNYAWTFFADRILYKTNSEKEKYIRDLAYKYQVKLPEFATDNYAPMKKEDIRKLDNTLIEIGSHTRSHPILSTCNTDELKDELVKSKTDLQNALCKDIEHFCFPNGCINDFDNRSIELLKNSGYKSAVTTINGFVNKNTDKYQLTRICWENNIYGKNNINGIYSVKETFFN